MMVVIIDQGFSITNKAHIQQLFEVLGSAVNPVLREGNSDRRAAVPVKEYAPLAAASWVAVKELVLSYHYKDTCYLTGFLNYGNLI